MRARLAALAAGVVLSAGCSVEAIVATIFPANPDEAIAVATCESGLDPNAVSPGNTAHGLFQIHRVHRATWEQSWSWELRYDPILNAAFAKALYDRQGWQPWAQECRP